MTGTEGLLKVSGKNTRKGAQRTTCASSRRVRNTGSAVASAQPTVSPARMKPSEIERLRRELMRQAGETGASQYRFRRRSEPSTDLCGEDWVSNAWRDILWVRLSRSCHRANHRYLRLSLVITRPGEGLLSEPLAGTRLGRRELGLKP